MKGAIIQLTSLSKERRRIMADLAIKGYIGEVCGHCDNSFDTVEDLDEAVFDDTQGEVISHRHCFIGAFGREALSDDD